MEGKCHNLILLNFFFRKWKSKCIFYWMIIADLVALEIVVKYKLERHGLSFVICIHGLKIIIIFRKVLFLLSRFNRFNHLNNDLLLDYTWLFHTFKPKSLLTCWNGYVFCGNVRLFDGITN